MKVEPVPEPAKHPVPLIESRIYLIRGQKVLLDGDLAVLHQVTTGNLNKAIQRNRGRFPQDFMFQLTREEDEALRFQFGIPNEGRGREDGSYRLRIGSKSRTAAHSSGRWHRE
jgi:hypothetical protein